MKPILLSLVLSMEQEAFAYDWSIVDNILIDQEVVHSLMHAPRARCLISLKLDIEKMYNYIHWPFLFNVLKYFGFHD